MTKTTAILPPPHPAMLPEETLLKQCTTEFGRMAGPGGQHRNKVETAVTLRHERSGVTASASERRRQYENRQTALRRLRLKLAVQVRTTIDLRRYRASELWQQRRQGKQMSINPRHRDYAALLAEAIDVITARDFDVAGAAGVLGISMSQLAKLIRHERHAFARLNDLREERGLQRLK